MYGVEMWGCGKQIGGSEQVQLHAARIFMGVGRLHPKVALLYEMRMLPLKWEARRCVEFWIKILRMSEDSLIKLVMLEAMGMGNKVRWWSDLEQSLREFGWDGMKVKDVERVSMTEIKQMMIDIAWREGKKLWDGEMQNHVKLKTLQKLMEDECKTRCMDVNDRRLRRILARLRGGTAALRIETGRWSGIRREERICNQCSIGEIEDVEHFLRM